MLFARVLEQTPGLVLVRLLWQSRGQLGLAHAHLWSQSLPMQQDLLRLSLEHVQPANKCHSRLRIKITHRPLPDTAAPLLALAISSATRHIRRGDQRTRDKNSENLGSSLLSSCRRQNFRNPPGSRGSGHPWSTARGWSSQLGHTAGTPTKALVLNCCKSRLDQQLTSNQGLVHAHSSTPDHASCALNSN